jgi:ubiquinone/menaquinone biosynthesis C-methylase UbiE
VSEGPPQGRHPSRPLMPASPASPSAPQRPPSQRPPSQPGIPAAGFGEGMAYDRRPSPARLEPAERPRPATTTQEATLYDAVVVPRWSTLFGRPLVAHTPLGLRGQVVDVGCGTGYPALDVMRRLADGGRVISVDRDAALVDIARRRAVENAGKRIFFKVEPIERLSFGDEVFDLAVGNLFVSAIDDESTALAVIRRVLKPGAKVLLTRPMLGTFEEVLDMFREIAVRRDSSALQKRIDQAALRTPTAATWRAQLASAGYEDIEVQVDDVRLPYRNAREIFADPMLKIVALPEWRFLCGTQPGDESMLGEVERALDTYFASGPLSLTVRTGLISARKPA